MMAIPAYVLAVLALLLHVAIAIVLIAKYRRTRDIGFLWLGIAVVVWPLVSRVLDFGVRTAVDRLVSKQPVGFFPFSLVEHGRLTLGELVLYFSSLSQLIGVCFLLVAVLYLSRTRNAISPQAAG
jgi:hypothetical protein